MSIRCLCQGKSSDDISHSGWLHKILPKNMFRFRGHASLTFANSVFQFLRLPHSGTLSIDNSTVTHGYRQEEVVASARCSSEAGWMSSSLEARAVPPPHQQSRPPLCWCVFGCVSPSCPGEEQISVRTRSTPSCCPIPSSCALRRWCRLLAVDAW